MVSRADRSLFARWWWAVDKPVLALSTILLCIGCVLSFAASPSVAARIGKIDNYIFVKQHLIFAVLSFFILLAISLLNPKYLKGIYVIIGIVSIFLLIGVLFFGYETKGSTRWLKILGLSLQPSELLKPGLTIIYAWMYSAITKHNRVLIYLCSGIGYIICVTLLLLEPDFGQTVLITCILGCMLFLSGINITFTSILLVTSLSIFYTVYLFSYHVHSRVQKYLTGIGDTFQVDMGRAAILHGGWFGVGLGEGTIKRIIPDSHTDFVFSVAAEEYGIAICSIIIVLIYVLVLRVMAVSCNEQNIFKKLAIMGLATQIGLQSFINIGVNLHLMPAKGMTLPFISYGGSSMISIALCVGAILCLSKK